MEHQSRLEFSLGASVVILILLILGGIISYWVDPAFGASGKISLLFWMMTWLQTLFFRG